MGHNSKTYAIIAATALSLTSCVDDWLSRSPQSQGAISFGIDIGGAPARSRSGAPSPQTLGMDVFPIISQADGDSMYVFAETSEWPDIKAHAADAPRSRSQMYTSADPCPDMMVSAYSYGADQGWDAEMINDAAPDYINNKRVSRHGLYYSFDSPQYWPKEGFLRFLAFAPAAYGTFTPDGSTAPEVKVTVPSNIADQRDFLVAYTDGISSARAGDPVNLNFKHALTAIRIKLAPDMVHCRIVSVSIQNIAMTGAFRYSNLAAPGASLPSASLDGCWYKHTNPRTDAFTVELDRHIGDHVDYDYLIDGDNTFYMIPQTHAADAQIVVTLQQINNAGQVVGHPEALVASLGGTQWKAGTMVTYTLSYENWWHGLYVDEIDPFPPLAAKPTDHCVGSKAFRITSFDISLDDINDRRAPWKATFSSDGGNTFTDAIPSWLTFSTDSLENSAVSSMSGPGSDGVADPLRLWCHAAEQTEYDENDIDAKMYSRPEIGTEARPYNLAASDGRLTNDTTCVENTANCYVVSQPGWYMFPCVYGNGIKDGTYNWVAFQPRVTAAHGLPLFINHLGNPITSPYISKNKDCVPHHHRFDLQDMPYLIAYTNDEPERAVQFDPTAYGGRGGIKFYVPKEYLRWGWSPAPRTQGNARISLCDAAGNTMWSWHIWVTGILDPAINDYGTLHLVNHAGTERDVAQVYLGWVSYQPLRIYRPRSCIMRITSTARNGHKKYVDILISQPRTVTHWPGHTCYFQWGRKDPFFGGEDNGYNKFKFNLQGWYYTENPVGRKMGPGIEGVKNTILHPADWHNIEEVWCDSNGDGIWEWEGYEQSFYNLWDATCTRQWADDDDGCEDPLERLSVKTVYDPCPVGWKVPQMSTFTGLARNGKYAANANAWNGIYRPYSYTTKDWTRDANSGVFMMYADTGRSRFLSFPLVGYRDWRMMTNGYSGPVLQFGTDVYVWTAGSHDENRAYYCCFGSPRNGTGFHVSVLNYYFHTDGCCVLPCEE